MCTCCCLARDAANSSATAAATEITPMPTSEDSKISADAGSRLNSAIASLSSRRGAGA